MKLNPLKLSHQAIILVSVPLVFELGFVITLNQLVVQAEEAARRADSARAIIDDASMVCKLSFDGVSALFSYMNRSDDQTLKDSYLKAKERIPAHVDGLIAKVLDRPQDEKDSANNLKLATAQEFRILDAVMEAIENHDRMRALRMSMSFYGFNSPTTRMAQELEFLTSREESTARSGQEANARQTIRNYLWLGVAINIVIAATLAALFYKGTLGRLQILMANARKLPKKEPLSPPLEGSDEMAELDHVFHETADSLSQVDRMKREFVSMISHDLRTPLTAVQGTLHLMRNGTYGPISQTGTERLAGSETSVKHLIKLINELIDIEKLESGKLDVVFGETVIEVVLERAVNAVQTVADQAGIIIENVETDAVVQADEDRLVQVLTNLLGNAIKFSPRGSKVCIETRETNEWLEVAVADQGRGIPGELLEKIFDRFAQVERDDEIKKGGSGLGLAICKAIIEQHGGQIGVDSKPGAGSRFWFRLPSRDPDQPLV